MGNAHPPGLPLAGIAQQDPQLKPLNAQEQFPPYWTDMPKNVQYLATDLNGCSGWRSR